MMTVAWNMPTTSTAKILPIMIISGVRGETRSWSRVPCSRSLATDRAVRMSALTVRMMATRLGRMNH